jgi:hypothetical protein
MNGGVSGRPHCETFIDDDYIVAYLVSLSRPMPRERMRVAPQPGLRVRRTRIQHGMNRVRCFAEENCK